MAAFSAFFSHRSTECLNPCGSMDDKIHDGGGPAESGSLVPGVMVIRGDRPEHGQVEMRMRIHAAGGDEFSRGVDDLRIRMPEVLSDPWRWIPLRSGCPPRRSRRR